jgi:hypothetical protein
VTLESVCAEADALRAAGDGEWALASAAIAEKLEVALAEPSGMTQVCAHVIELAAARGCTRLLGASSVGDRLAAVASTLASNGIRAGSPEVGDRVMILDGCLATGWQVREAATRVCDSDATPVVAAVVIRTADVALEDAVESVVVLATRS